MRRIRVASLAERDLDDIWNRIATQSSSIEIANGVIESITETFPSFAGTPEAGTRRDDIELGVRGFPVGKCIIYYRVSGNYLVISRVIHGCATKSLPTSQMRSEGQSSACSSKLDRLELIREGFVRLDGNSPIVEYQNRRSRRYYAVDNHSSRPYLSW